MQNGLGPLLRQGDRKGAIRVRPSDQQHRYLAPALGKIDLDVTKVCFGALARLVFKRDERLSFSSPLAVNVTPHLVLAAGVVVLLDQSAKHLSRRVPLFGRSLLISRKNLVDHRPKRSQLRR